MKRLFYILFFFILFSCKKNNQQEVVNIHLQENFVNLTQARELANGIIFTSKKSSNNIKNVSPSTRTVEDIYEFKNEEKRTTFYLINYKESGFVILTADRRTMPVLAFSEEVNFRLTNLSILRD